MRLGALALSSDNDNCVERECSEDLILIIQFKECLGDPLVTWKRGYSALFNILMVNQS